MTFHRTALFFLGILFFQTGLGKNKPMKDSILLEQIQVTGIQLPVPVEKEPASVTVIPREVLEKTEASSVLTGLKGLVPGLFITERSTTGFGVFTGAGGGISLRGLGGSPTTQVLIAIDGHPQMMGINGHDLPDAYVSYQAESVVITRGPASTVYGSNAMGGVINILTREKKTDGLEGQASVMQGSFQTGKYQLSLNAKKDKLSAFLSTNYDQTDGHRAHSAFHLFNAYGKLGYILSDRFKTHADFSLSNYRSTDPGPITKPAISDSLTADVLRGMASFSLDNRFSQSSGKMKIYYDFGHHEIYDGWQSDDYNAGFQADQTFSVRKGNLMTFGLDQQIYGGKAIRTTNPNFHLNKTMQETAFYLLASQTFLNERLTADAGLRLTMSSLFGDDWIPRLGLTYQADESSILKISTAKGYRNPTIRELYVFAPNPYLRPENTINYEFSYTRFLWDKRFRGEFCIYQSLGSNLIQTVVNGGIPTFVNSGSFNNKGLELALNYKFLNNLTVNGNYSYIRCKRPLLGTPEHQFNLGADYSLGKWTFRGNLQQVQNYYLKVGTAPLQEDFSLLDAKIGYQLTKQCRIFCKADNILNQSYQVNLNYPLPGRTILGGIKVSLGQ